MALLDSKAQQKVKQSRFVKGAYLGVYTAMMQGYSLINDPTSQIECLKKCLVVLQELRVCGLTGLGTHENRVIFQLASLYESQSKYEESKGFYERALSVSKEIGDRKGEALAYENLGTVCHSLGEFVKAKKYFHNALMVRKDIGDRKGEALACKNLGTECRSLGEDVKAKEYFHNALVIRKEIGDRQGEASVYGDLGTVFQSLGEFGKALDYHEKALAIRKETGDRQAEVSSYVDLGNVFYSLGKCFKAKEYLQKAIPVTEELGDRKREALCYGNLGTIFQSLGEYSEAERCHRKALAITKEIGDRKGESADLCSLAAALMSLEEYGKAEECHEKALAISKELGDKKGEAKCYETLGTVCDSLGKHAKAKDYLYKALVIRKEIGDRRGEATNYGNLGAVFLSLGECDKALEYHEKALVASKEFGDREGEAADHINLGTVFCSLGDHDKATEHVQKALAINKEIANRKIEASCYGNLGAISQRLGEHTKAIKYLQRALTILEEFEIDDRKGEARCYGNLGSAFKSLGEYGKAEEYHEKALAMNKKIGDREGETAAYGNLGTLFYSLGQYDKAKEYHGKALALSRDIGFIKAEFECHVNLTMDLLSEGNISEAFSNVVVSIFTCEKMRGFLTENEQFKISFLDEHAVSYRLLSTLLCATRNHNEALYVVELGRARALADLMSTQYSVVQEISVNPQTWVGIEMIMRKENKSTCLCISYYFQLIFLWILKENKPILFRRADVNEFFEGSERDLDVDDLFGNETFRKFQVLPQEHCEDRSLPSPSNPVGQPARESQEDGLTVFRKENKDDAQDTEPSLSLYYKMFIAPVADFLDEPEIIIVPPSSLYKVPFAALKDGNEKYLSESFRIRIVPSLTTLKLIHDSPADYHSQTGALIVGDPQVGEVLYKGNIWNLLRLPSAEKEAKMIGRLVGTQPLLGQHATKQAVLRSINSASLIHFAAHGNPDRGEIALAPVRTTDDIPQEEDYLLTMADISQVRLRAKLVVLSCCHSASGQIRTEGVIGIARAFLGSGARSVLVALWALDDNATEQLMSRFYEHLVHGESASESLHQAMKWMRSNGYTNVRDWAPFVLIGDSVKFDFGGEKVSLKP